MLCRNQRIKVHIADYRTGGDMFFRLQFKSIEQNQNKEDIENPSNHPFSTPAYLILWVTGSAGTLKIKKKNKKGDKVAELM